MQFNETTTIPYRRFLDALPDGVICYQAVRTEGVITDCRAVFVNQAAQHINQQHDLKIQVGELLMANYSQLPGLAVITHYIFGLQKTVLHTGQPVTDTRWIERLANWYSFRFTPLGDDLIMVIYHDATQAVEMAQQQDRQRQLQQGILDASLNGIIAYKAVRDEAGGITDFQFLQYNDMAKRYLKLPPDVLERTMLDLFPGSMQEDIMNRYVRVVETGEPVQFRTDYNSDELTACFDISVVKMDDGIVLTFLDVTAEEASKAKLEEQARQLQLILDGAINSVVSLRTVQTEESVIDFTYEALNQSAMNFLDTQDPSTVLGQQISKMYPTTRDSGLFDLYVHSVTTQQAQRQEVRLDMAGADMWLDVSVVPINKDQLVVSFMNTTSIVEGRRQLEALVDELRKSNESLEQFAYVASHDLQEPLRKINAFGGVLLDQYAPQLGEAGGDMIRRMRVAATRMQALIDDLLLFSRLTAQKQPFKPVDINVLLADVLFDLDEVIRQKQAVVEATNLFTIPGDVSQLRHLLLNLLSNALKFTLPNRPPVVTITCQQMTLKTVQELLPAANHMAGYFCVDVRDNGIGFDQKYTDRIMQMFQRLHGRDEYPGTGIGLAIVQKVAENHRGFIRAESEPGQGASFCVYLPIG